MNNVETIAYPIQAQGYIHNWLVAGPQAIAVTDLSRFATHDLQQEIAAAYHQSNHPITQSPAELAPLPINDVQGKAQLLWRAMRCSADHAVDCTGFYDICHYLRTWAYTELVIPDERMVTFLLTTNGPATVWINDQPVHEHSHFHAQFAPPYPFTTQLQPGRNRVLVCFSHVALHDCPYRLALQITGVDPAELTVQIPTTLPVKRRQALEQIFDAAYLDRDLYHREDEIIVRWPAEFKLAGEITIRVQTPQGRIYSEGQPTVRGGAVVNLGKAYQRPDGDYWVTLMPRSEDYHVHGLHVQRHIPIHIANSNFAQTPYGTYTARRHEALLDAAGRTTHVYSEIAKMALGRWDRLKLDRLAVTTGQIHQHTTGSTFGLVALLGALLRYGDDPVFPSAVKHEIEPCALNFPYWMDEGFPDTGGDWPEHRQILLHTCEVLAGQHFPDRLFSHANQTGHWHQAKGEERAFSWLRKRAQGGFREWDSNSYFEPMVLALSHLADLAENEDLAEMATVVLDKLLFTLALNSFQGVFGSTHGSAEASSIKNARLEPTASISRLLWGLGTFNEHLAGSVSLACAQRYEVPPPIYEIGTTPVEELWSRERHAGVLESWCDREEGPWEVNKVTYKTPDFMLCSAQDYRAGQPGDQQHIWQATLGPDAIIFVNHPACISQANSHHPNFWRGNAILPRVAQWKDALIALHNLPADDWMGFTHAYFPTAHFDEYVLRDRWAFARKGDGYLALMATAGLSLTTTGDNAYRELRAYGQQQGWFCQLGRAAVDGSFVEFQTTIITLDITFDAFAIHATTLRGESLDFGWEGPLLVNELEQSLHHFHHYDSPFCVSELRAEVMEIRAWQSAMQLDFRQRSLDNRLL